MKPKVSIITPTYNRSHLLPRVWSSISSQTEQNFQWIIIDDGSTDNTREVIEEFNDSRIIYYWQENMGCNVARNSGEKLIKAEFFIHLDSDDELYDEKTLNVMLKEIEQTRPEIAMVFFTVVNSEKQPDYCYLSNDRFESNDQDYLCQEKMRGEFMIIARSNVTSITSWTRYNGFERLRNTRIFKQRPSLFVNIPARIYHRNENDHLTGIKAAFDRAQDMVDASTEFIEEHKNAMLKYCPYQIGYFNFYKSLFLAITTSGYKAVPGILAAFRYGKIDIRFKSLILCIALLFPLIIRKKLIVLYWKCKGLK